MRHTWFRKRWGLAAVVLCLAAAGAGCGGGGEIRRAVSAASDEIDATQAANPNLRLTYLRQTEDGEPYELRSMKIDGSDDRLLDSAAVLQRVAASNNSSEVYYIRADDIYPMGREVYSASTTGGGITRHTNNGYTDYHVRHLESGSVYYSENHDLGGENYQGDVFRLTDSGTVQVENTSTFGVWFDVSPDEDYIVYLDDFSSSKKLYKYDIASGVETLFATQSEHISYTFRISPDSSKILYLSDCGDSISTICKNIHVIDASGETIMEQTNTVVGIGAWSPDSTRFAVLQAEIVGSEVHAAVNIYNVNTGAKTTILSSADEVYYISDWSPDGTMLAGYKTPWSGGKSDLFTVKADGSGLVELTNSADGEFSGNPLFTR